MAVRNAIEGRRREVGAVYLWTVFNTSVREEINLKSTAEHHRVGMKHLDHDLTWRKTTKRWIQQTTTNHSLWVGIEPSVRIHAGFHHSEMVEPTEFRRHFEDMGLKTQLPSRVNLADTNFVVNFWQF